MKRRATSAAKRSGVARSKLSESDIQTAIMNKLFVHPLVAWCHVTTSGKVRGRGGHWMTLGFPGLSDIIGQTRDGRILAIEVKAPGEDATEVQQEFIDTVNKYGGRAGVAHSVAEAFNVVERGL